jgi:phenylalanyl-tRNA synthetase alpha chain
MAELPEELAEALARFETQVAGVSDRAAWEELRLEWFGKKRGKVRDFESRIREIEPEKRRDWGQGVNTLKKTLEAGLQQLDERLQRGEKSKSASSQAIDVTLPGRLPEVGSYHPITLVTAEIERIFLQLGFSVAEGPEIEDDFHNFEALNIPEGHPARDEQDTFFTTDGRLLRTHTSPVQIRSMLSRKPPLRIICPGRVYRNDNDLRHSPMFHQVEGLCIDEGITFGHLKGTLEAFLTRLFDPSTRVRLRPSFFPFTEPSAEVDISCPFCKGTGQQEGKDGCGTCSSTGWMEILGCGMVDPRVLQNCGIDPDRYSGWAFGLGIDRVAMIRYAFPNIRTLFENDERLLRQVR